MFKLVKIEGSRINVPEPEYLPVGTTAVESGEGLVLSSGKLVNSGTAKPTFIALADADANAAELAVGRVTADSVYEVELNADIGTENVPTAGAKVAVVGGKTVAGATSTSGAATVISIGEASKTGDKIRVRFV